MYPAPVDSRSLTIADATEGLCRYYDHVLREISKADSPKSRKLLDDIDDEEVYDDLLDEIETDKTIH